MGRHQSWRSLETQWKIGGEHEMHVCIARSVLAEIPQHVY